jgi:hypothetical protein
VYAEMAKKIIQKYAFFIELQGRNLFIMGNDDNGATTPPGAFTSGITRFNHG